MLLWVVSRVVLTSIWRNDQSAMESNRIRSVNSLNSIHRYSIVWDSVRCMGQRRLAIAPTPPLCSVDLNRARWNSANRTVSSQLLCQFRNTENKPTANDEREFHSNHAYSPNITSAIAVTENTGNKICFDFITIITLQTISKHETSQDKHKCSEVLRHSIFILFCLMEENISRWHIAWITGEKISTFSQLDLCRFSIR